MELTCPLPLQYEQIVTAHGGGRLMQQLLARVVQLTAYRVRWGSQAHPQPTQFNPTYAVLHFIALIHKYPLNANSLYNQALNTVLFKLLKT
ncbi:MAG: hypothetical protein WCK96_01755 [Methylococcales bacterium]